MFFKLKRPSRIIQKTSKIPAKKRISSDAFTKIYSQFHKPILNYVKSKISDEQSAQDITQEVFIKVFRFHESYHDGKVFSTWLWTIAKNTISDFLRKRLTSADKISCDEVVCTRRDAESTLVYRDERRDLLRMIRPLTRLQKRVLWLRAIHQLSYGEISEKLGLSITAVKNLAHRAKNRLSHEKPGLAPVF